MRLRPASSGGSKRVTGIALPEADIETILQLEPIVWKEQNTALQSAPGAVQFQAVPSSSTKLPKQDNIPLRRNRSLFASAVIALAILGAACTWWLVGLRRIDAVPNVKEAASAPAVNSRVVSVPAKKFEIAPIAQSEELMQAATNPVATRSDVQSNAQTDGSKIRSRSANADKVKTRREAIQKRKADNDAAKKAEAAKAARSQDAVRVRASTLPNMKDELPRLAKLKPVLQTPQQACSDRSNFISRGICESRECEKPERAKLKFCIDMHERRAPHD